MVLRRFIVLLTLLLLSGGSKAQIDDVRLWTGVSIQHKFTRRLTGSIEEQLRFRNDITQIDQVFTDAGLSYQLFKNFKLALNYRFVRKNEHNYYSIAHRFYVDAAYRLKVGSVAFTLRERVMQQYKDYNSSELGKIPEWLLRSKLTAKFDMQRKYSPYIGAEMYYVIDNAKEKDNLISRIRYSAGVEYEFNRIHTLDVFVLLQHDRPDDFNSFVFGTSYCYTF